MVCHNCGREVKLVGKVGRKDECPQCHADMHCCKNCSYFDPGQSKQCTESEADYVRDKLKANFCEFFEPTRRVALTTRGMQQGSSGGGKSDDVRKAFDALFKK